MKNIYNAELIEMIFERIPDIKIVAKEPTLVLSHEVEDWDFICILAMRMGFVTERWMQNEEPRTTIYNRALKTTT